MDTKSAEQANLFRSLGNSFFQKRQFFHALLIYNHSLCYAVNGSAEEAFIYANRSAVYFENSLYERCLENIQKAEKLNHPKPEILAARREKCVELMKLGEDRQFKRHKFQLSYPAHEKFPFLVERLEFRKDKDGKGHMYATQDLKVGDVIAFGESFSPIINETNFHQRCSFCLNDNQFSLIACPSCITTMYCSEECLKTAYQRYHRYECGMQIGRKELRSFFVALSLFDDDIAKLEKFLTENLVKKNFLLDFDFSNASPIEIQKQKLLAYLSMDYPRLKTPYVAHLIKSTEEVFKKHEKLKKFWASHKVFIRSFIKKQIEFDTGMPFDRDIYAPCLKAGGKGENFDTPNDAVANSIAATSAVPLDECFSHSCASRIRKATIDGKLMVLVVFPIKKGDEVFDCRVCSSFESAPKYYRKSIIMQYLGIDCQCEACVNDYEEFQNLPHPQSKFSKKVSRDKEALDMLEMMSPDKVLEKIQLCRELQEANEENYPDRNSFLIQLVMVGCFLRLNQPPLFFP